MAKKILLILTAFILGAVSDAALFRLPKLHECYVTSNEVMDIVDYYSVMLARSLNTCEDIINDNIILTRQHKNITIENARLIEACKIRGLNIKNEEQ